MEAIDTFRDAEIGLAGEVSTRFRDLGIVRFGIAVDYVAALPSGQNSDGSLFLLVLAEHRGTRSTKHALLAQLSLELKLPLRLILGIFEMSEANTPGVGGVLTKHGLAAIPEAHCYLSDGRNRIDVIGPPSAFPTEPRIFLYEEVIHPEQVGSYERLVHQSFIRRWLLERNLKDSWNVERLWFVREECIAALSEFTY